MQLSLTGIGASLASEDGYAVVKELIPGGPADKDGRIQPEDKIIGIQKDDNTEVDFVEKKLKRRRQARSGATPGPTSGSSSSRTSPRIRRSTTSIRQKVEIDRFSTPKVRSSRLTSTAR